MKRRVDRLLSSQTAVGGRRPEAAIERLHLERPFVTAAGADPPVVCKVRLFSWNGISVKVGSLLYSRLRFSSFGTPSGSSENHFYDKKICNSWAS